MENKPHAISVLMSMGCKLVYNVLDMSAIDYAIYYKYPEAALAMVTHEERANEVMALRSDKHPCVTLALIASMPRVFEAVQDKCITKANCKKDSKSFYVSQSCSEWSKGSANLTSTQLNSPHHLTLSYPKSPHWSTTINNLIIFSLTLRNLD